MLKLRRGQSVSVLGEKLEYVAKFDVSQAFWLSRVGSRLSEPTKKPPRKQLTVPVPTPCVEAPIQAGQFLIFRTVQPSSQIKAGRMFRLSEYPEQALRWAGSYRSKSDHGLIAIKVSGSKEKRDMIHQVCPVIGKGNYLILRLL